MFLGFFSLGENLTSQQLNEIVWGKGLLEGGALRITDVPTWLSLVLEIFPDTNTFVWTKKD